MTNNSHTNTNMADLEHCQEIKSESGSIYLTVGVKLDKLALLTKGGYLFLLDIKVLDDLINVLIKIRDAINEQKNT